MSNSEHMSIKNFTENDRIGGCYIITDVHLCCTSVGKPFLSAKLMDNSGSISIKFWNYSGVISGDSNGSIVCAIGTVKSYRNSIELHAEFLELAEEFEYISELPDIVPSAPIDSENRWKYLLSMYYSIKDYTYSVLLGKVITKHAEALYTIPAAKGMHHAFRHGLLMHITDMAWVAEKLADKYSYAVDRDLLITGVLLHDLGKVWEFEVSAQTGIVQGYSTDGNLLGHAILGIQEINRIAESENLDRSKILLLEHIIASHHGIPEWGAAKEPITLEAMLVHIIDNLDSKVEIYREATRFTKVGGYSAYIPTLAKKA